MRTRRLLIIAVTVLVLVLVIQLTVKLSITPKVSTYAIWAQRPANILEAKGLSNLIVTARVTNIERGDDLVATPPQEPQPIRIPVEVVTLEIEEYHKGAPRGNYQAYKEIKLFHTGSSYATPVEGRTDPPSSEQPPRPSGGVDRPATSPPSPSIEETRTIIIHEDPPYKKGERYVLLLTDGPTVTVNGSKIATKSVISPEGRYLITSRKKIEPATMRGFAGLYKGKELKGLEKELKVRDEFRIINRLTRPGDIRIIDTLRFDR